MRDALGRRRRGEDDLVQHLVHALAHDGLVAAAVAGFPHHLRDRGSLIYETALTSPADHNITITATHIKPLLRAHLLHEQNLRDPQLRPHVRDRLAVHEVFL